MTCDANGNLTADGTNTYTWNARNLLASIGGGSSAGFQYDGLGRRIQKSVGGQVTRYLHDGLNPVQEQDALGAPVANLLTGLSIDEFFQRTDSEGGRSYPADILGSTLALTDAAGSMATSYSYEPFGTVTVNGADSGNPVQFTGRENDGAGPQYSRARYYSATFQRFVSEDPIGFASGDVNLYAYVSNDTLNATDASGLGEVKPGPTRPRLRPDWMRPPKFPPDPPTDIRPRLPRDAPYCTRPPLFPPLPMFPVDPIAFVIPIEPFRDPCRYVPGMCGPEMI
jgi:RHS repeat-associated protein